MWDFDALAHLQSSAPTSFGDPRDQRHQSSRRRVLSILTCSVRKGIRAN